MATGSTHTPDYPSAHAQLHGTDPVWRLVLCARPGSGLTAAGHVLPVAAARAVLALPFPILISCKGRESSRCFTGCHGTRGRRCLAGIRSQSMRDDDAHGLTYGQTHEHFAPLTRQRLQVRVRAQLRAPAPVLVAAAAAPANEVLQVAVVVRVPPLRQRLLQQLGAVHAGGYVGLAVRARLERYEAMRITVRLAVLH